MTVVVLYACCIIFCIGPVWTESYINFKLTTGDVQPSNFICSFADTSLSLRTYSIFITQARNLKPDWIVFKHPGKFTSTGESC